MKSLPISSSYSLPSTNLTYYVHLPFSLVKLARAAMFLALEPLSSNGQPWLGLAWQELPEMRSLAQLRSAQRSAAQSSKA